MGVKIRLARHGRKKKPFYHIVVADARAPRDGKFIEKIGTYNPLTIPATVTLDRDKAVEWIGKGAQPTDTVRSILKFQGVLYKIHLLKGVKKGVLSEEKAEQIYSEFIREKEQKIRQRFQKTAEEKKAFWNMVSGVAKPVETPVAEEEVTAIEEEVTEPVDLPVDENDSQPATEESAVSVEESSDKEEA